MFFHSVEFYIILTVVGAIIVGFSALPSGIGEVKQYLLAGKIFATDDATTDPSIELLCRDDGSVLLWRRGLTDIYSNGAVSLAINVKGFDISIEERLTPGRPATDVEPITDATFELKFLGAERYHVHYNSDATGMMATCTLHNRPGINILRPLRH